MGNDPRDIPLGRRHEGRKRADWRVRAENGIEWQRDRRCLERPPSPGIEVHRKSVAIDAAKGSGASRLARSATPRYIQFPSIRIASDQVAVDLQAHCDGQRGIDREAAMPARMAATRPW
jgi:hypothetical protein